MGEPAVRRMGGGLTIPNGWGDAVSSRSSEAADILQEKYGLSVR